MAFIIPIWFIIGAICAIVGLTLQIWLTLAIFLAWPASVILSWIWHDKKYIVMAVGYFRRDLRPVVLYFYTGGERPQYSLARFTNDRWQCPVFWASGIGKCILLPNGLVDPISQSNYILYWRPLRKTELMMHLFTEVEHVWGVKGINRYH